jgi:hypothetical protein
VTEGLKYDGEKPRMDLLDADHLENVAKVLTFGAKKYAKYGECNCQHTNKNIDKETGSVLISGVENILPLTQNIERSEQGLLLKGITELQKNNLISFFQSNNVKFVVKNGNSILITATKLPAFVVDFVEDAILHSAKWNGKDGWILHENTCLSLREIKTGAHNWRNGINTSRLIAAAYRHLGAINRGEDIDPESGLDHAAHLGCCVQFLDWTLHNKPELDDRWKNSVTEGK